MAILYNSFTSRFTWSWHTFELWRNWSKRRITCFPLSCLIFHLSFEYHDHFPYPQSFVTTFPRAHTNHKTPSQLLVTSTESRRLVLDRDITSRRRLIFAPDEVVDFLVLGLLHSRLVVLRSLIEELFLDEINSLTMLVFCFCTRRFGKRIIREKETLGR